MADTQNFDKLNILKRRSIPYKEYFGEMELTEKQRKDRMSTVLILEDYIMIFFNLIESGANEATVKQEMVYMIYELVDDEKFFADDERQESKYVTGLVKELYESTVENLEKFPKDYDYTGAKPYWLSEDRAKFVAENEANTLWASKEYIDAKAEGKKYKIWMSFGDDRVRLTHQIVDGAKIPIDAYFDVGRARMLYPKDVTSPESTGAECPEETINCRCSIHYI